MHESRKFCRKGSDFDVFFVLFLFAEVKNVPNTTISRPSSAHQRNAI